MTTPTTEDRDRLVAAVHATGQAPRWLDQITEWLALPTTTQARVRCMTRKLEEIAQLIEQRDQLQSSDNF